MTLPPPSVGQELTQSSCAQALTGSQADYVLITRAEERMHKVGGKQQADSLGPQAPQAPSTALMRARGADGHTQGAKDYCPYPKRSQRKNPEDKSREGGSGWGVWGGGAPAVILQAENLTIFVIYW